MWKIGGNRRAVFCGVGREDLSSWTICRVGVVEKNELDDNTVKELKTPEQFLFKLRKDDDGENPEEIADTAQPRSESPVSGVKAGTAPARKTPEQKGTGEENGKSRKSGSEPGKGV